MGHAAAMKRWGEVPGEWICQAHWSRLTKRERAVHNRHRRQFLRLGFQPHPAAAARVWASCKRRAALPDAV